jgi:Fur family transcriptional regulator, ferric uptake regulator
MPVDASTLLAAAGLQPTRQRLAIVAELVREPNDVTAQELHDRLRARGPAPGLATVYRTLTRLEEAGVVDALTHHAGELCYRLCGDDHHHHFVCSSCHGVVEVGDCRLEPWLEDLADAHGFAVTGHRVELEGVCASCR